MAILGTILTVLFIIVSILLVLIILLQSNRSAGMGIFGGGSNSAFGSSSADVLTKTTAVLAAAFMLIALALAFIKSRVHDRSEIEKQISSPAEPNLVAPPSAGDSATPATP